VLKNHRGRGRYLRPWLRLSLRPRCVTPMTSSGVAPDRNVPPKPRRTRCGRRRKSGSNRQADGFRTKEKGRQVNRRSPRIRHYLATDIQYQMEDGRRLRLRLPLLKMTNIFRREMDEIWNPMENDTQSF